MGCSFVVIAEDAPLEFTVTRESRWGKAGIRASGEWVSERKNPRRVGRSSWLPTRLGGCELGAAAGPGEQTPGAGFVFEISWVVSGKELFFEADFDGEER